MNLAFTKMHGAGNDFVVLDASDGRFALDPAQIRRLADRHFGIGCDQVLVSSARPRKAAAPERISAIESSTRMAARSSSAATARAAW